MYKLPKTLSNDISKFASLMEGYKEKKVSATEFKAYRVPMGIYEQRTNEVYMARVRTTGGVIYPKQLLQLMEIAINHHSNLLHLTTRQEIQIQNLELEDVEPILLKLKNVGLATKGGGGNTVRNIIVSEGSGIDQDEVFDVTPYAMALTSLLIAEADSYLLPRKLKIAFSSHDKRIEHAAINDVGLVARLVDGQRGFRVYVGGGGGAKPTVGWLLFDFLPAGDLHVLLKALKSFFSEHGNRKNRNQARMRYIFYRLGEDETLRLIREYYAGAKENGTGIKLQKTVDERPSSLHIPETKALHIIESDEYVLWKKRYVTPQRQTGYSSVTIPVVLGNIPLDDQSYVLGFQKLLRFVDQFGEQTIRFTTAQNIRLRNLPDRAIPELFLILKEFVNEITAPSLIHRIVSCTGADTCRLGIGLSKGLARAIHRELLQSKLDLDRLSTVKIHISGCPNSCGQQVWADIGFSGKVLRNDRSYPGYQIYLGASTYVDPQLAEPLGSISAKDVPRFVHRLLDAYLSTITQYVDFTSFAKAEGRDIALRLIEKFKQIPSFEEDKNYYFDWGAENLFSVATRGQAECSAGLFDMINVDLTSIKDYKKQLADERDAAKRNGLLHAIVYAASRMLLVTRGLDPNTPQEVYDLFIRHFIHSGLINKGFEPIVTTARDHPSADLGLLESEIYSLGDAVMELYAGMDDSLQFKKTSQTGLNEMEKTNEIEKTNGFAQATALPLDQVKARKTIDLRGLVCPVNFVRTKLELGMMKSGDELEVWLDDGHPITNVPKAVQNEGHVIVDRRKTGKYWKVIIRNK